MFKMRMAAAVAALCAAIGLKCTEAQAVPLQFTVTGDGISYSWMLDSNPVPAGFNPDGYWWTELPGTTLYFLDSSYGGGFQAAGATNIGLAGDVLFTGTLSAPVFTPGLYSIPDDYLRGVDAHATLRISLTPIPGTLVFFSSGLCLLGCLRRRRTA